MSLQPRVIGIYGFAVQEIVHRPFLGVLRYCDEVGGLETRDFRTLDVIDHNGVVLTPPWKGRCDGLVISTGHAPGWSDRDVANWVERGGVPAISVSGDWHDPRFVSIHTDQHAVGIMAAKHLHESICRSYLFVGLVGSQGSMRRAEGFRAELARRKCSVTEYCTQRPLIGTVEDDATLRAEPGLPKAIARLPKPLGVWVINDIYAAAMCRFCKKLDLHVPDDVRVLGTDDTSFARANVPALSSIRTAGERIGFLAAKALHRLLDGKRSASAVVPPEELVLRDSTIKQHRPLGTMSEAVEFIARHACTGVTVEQVAQSLGMPRRTFLEQFQRHVGRSPRDEIHRVRLETAKKLLDHERLSISRIASIVGFAETAAFSKFFTKHTGQSPRAYRQPQVRTARGAAKKKSPAAPPKRKRRST